MHAEEGPALRSDELAPQSDVDSMVPEISRRVGTILDAVESEATRIREETRAEAAQYLEEARRQADALVEARRRRIAQLSDELITKAEAVVTRLDDAAPVRAGFENLVRTLGDAAERLAEEAENPADPLPPAPTAADPLAPNGRTAPAPAVAADRGEPAPVGAGEQAWSTSFAGAPVRSDLDEVRTVAIQMAAGGGTRGDVREHLHRSLGVSEATGILDEVFGAGSGEQDRVPWTA
jgi:hypothetical protein